MTFIWRQISEAKNNPRVQKGRVPPPPTHTLPGPGLCRLSAGPITLTLWVGGVSCVGPSLPSVCWPSPPTHHDHIHTHTPSSPGACKGPVTGTHPDHPHTTLHVGDSPLQKVIRETNLCLETVQHAYQRIYIPMHCLHAR